MLIYEETDRQADNSKVINVSFNDFNHSMSYEAQPESRTQEAEPQRVGGINQI